MIDAGAHKISQSHRNLPFLLERYSLDERLVSFKFVALPSMKLNPVIYTIKFGLYPKNFSDYFYILNRNMLDCK